MRVLLIFFSLIFTQANAQPNIVWQKAFGGSNSDQATTIKQTSDGGYIVGGYTTSNDGDVSNYHGGLDMWVVKIDNNGSPQWKKSFGGNDHERLSSIQETIDGGFILAGNTHSNNGDVSGNHGDYDVWLLKITIDGQVEWQKCFGGSDWDEASDVHQTTDGGYIVAGRSRSTDGDIIGSYGSFDYWIIKVDQIGVLEWQKTYGGSGIDDAYSIDQTKDSGYVVAGSSNSTDGTVSGNHGEVDCWVVKLNFEGKIEWEQSFGGSGIDDARDIQQTFDGGYIVLGQISSNDGDVTGHHGGFDFWAIKLDKAGNLDWQKALGGSDQDNAMSICQTNDHGYVMIGTTQSTNGDVVGNDGGADYWMVKLSESGNLEWQKTVGGTQQELGFDIQQTTDLGYIVAGYAWSNNGDVSGVHGKSDFWVVKLSPESTPTTTPQTLPLEIFPNPATQTISINIPFEASNLTICITDLLGRELSRQAQHNIVPGSIEVPVSTLPDGMYLINVQTEDGRIFSGKFSKQD